MKVQASARVGDMLCIAGMVGRDASGAVVPGTEAQVRRALERIEEVLREHELDRRALVRLRVFMTETTDWPVVRDTISDFLGDEWPPATAVVVAALVEPTMKVELEAEASFA